MKMINTKYGNSVPVSNEEYKVILKIRESVYVNDREMDIRDASLTERLVSRGVIDKMIRNNKTWYTISVKENNQ